MKMGVADKPSQPLRSGAAASILAPSPARPLEERRASQQGTHSRQPTEAL